MRSEVFRGVGGQSSLSSLGPQAGSEGLKDLGFPVLHPAEAGGEYPPAAAKACILPGQGGELLGKRFGERPILEGRMPLSDSVPCSGGAAESASGKGGRRWADAWP